MQIAQSAPATSLPHSTALRSSLAGRAALALAGSLFVALCAHISLPLPFTPVPLTFSDLAVLLVGLALGPSLGFAALTLYLLEGAAGLPVFSPFGAPGIARFAGQTAGYLLAYPAAAAIAGYVTGRLGRLTSRFLAAFTACTLAGTLIMICGTGWLGLLLHLSAARAFTLGAAPFLPGQIVKILSAAGIYASLARQGQEELLHPKY